MKPSKTIPRYVFSLPGAAFSMNLSPKAAIRPACSFVALDLIVVRAETIDHTSLPESSREANAMTFSTSPFTAASIKSSFAVNWSFFSKSRLANS